MVPGSSMCRRVRQSNFDAVVDGIHCIDMKGAALHGIDGFEIKATGLTAVRGVLVPRARTCAI